MPSSKVRVFFPALCYLCPEMATRPAESDYVDRILGPAEKFEFPRWYVERIRGFKPEP